MNKPEERGKREDVVVEPLTEEFIAWRCLQGGSISGQAIDSWPSDSRIPWERYLRRNVPLLMKLTKTYGACAIVARDRDKMVGQLRFYPKAVCDMEGAGGLCLQQDYPSGPSDDFAEKSFPSLARIQDKTLSVHCLMIGAPQQKANPYQRRGIGTRLVIGLIAWSQAQGWDRIEAISFEDIPIIYEITGSAGHTFWEKLGFSLADRYPHPDLQGRDEFVLELEKQAISLGLPPSRARDQLVMRLSLR